MESTKEVLPVYTLNAEFTKPLWVFGLNSYDFLHKSDQKDLISCSYRYAETLIRFVNNIFFFFMNFLLLCFDKTVRQLFQFCCDLYRGGKYLQDEWEVISWNCGCDAEQNITT